MCAMEGFFHSAVLKLGNSPPRNALPGSFSMRVSRTESIYFNSPAVSRRRKEGWNSWRVLAICILEGHGIASESPSITLPKSSNLLLLSHKRNNSDKCSYTFRCPLCRRSDWDNTGGQTCPWRACWKPEWLNRCSNESKVFLFENSGLHCREEQQTVHNLFWKNY